MIGLSIIAMIVWTDLTIRRRHDRGRSGVDAAIFQILLLASVIIHTFGKAPDIVGYLDAFLVLLGVQTAATTSAAGRYPGTHGCSAHAPIRADDEHQRHRHGPGDR